jgi:hypothetical protein
MVNNPLQDQARSNIMLAANLITKINLGPLFTGLRPILTMQSGFSENTTASRTF